MSDDLLRAVPDLKRTVWAALEPTLTRACDWLSRLIGRWS